jgi:hypothetical protein
VSLDQNYEAVLLYDSNGVEMAVANGVAIPVGQRGYVIAGSDGSNLRFLKTDTTGALITTGTAASEEATWTARASAVSLALDKSLLSILNVDATLIVRLRQIWIVNAQITTVTGVIGTFELHRITGHSVGTSVTPQPADTNDVLDGDITVRSGATVAGEDAAILQHWQWSTDEWSSGSPVVSAADHTAQTLTPCYQTPDQAKPWILRQNQGLSLKFTTNTTVGSFDVMFVFTVT